MSGQMKKNLKELSSSIKKNIARVERQFSSAGMKPKRAILISTAKYYRVLDRLARE